MASVQSAAPSTPPPPARLHSPPTPKHGGFHDDWEPFTPRKSARISAKKASAARTPSPATTRQKLQHRSPRVNKSSSAMASPSSPVKKRAVSASSTRNSSGTLTADDSANAAAKLGLKAPHPSTSMLPTPSKTPTNRHTKKDEAQLKAVSRNIFMAKEDEVFPTLKKRRAKKYNGISLESFRAEVVEEEIPIYTDSQERIPEIDESADNPFYGAGARGGATTRSRSKRIAKVNVPGEGPQEVEDTLVREDGIVYVFRGKKKFRKFKDVSDSSEGPAHSAGDASPSRPLTRSSLKPRLLFPPKSTSEIEEEEAPTDIEEDAADDRAANPEFSTPADPADMEPATPKAPKFAPASPPTTARTTRTSSKPIAPAKGAVAAKGGSLFDNWPRKKATSSGQKRQADSLEGGASKRARSSV